MVTIGGWSNNGILNGGGDACDLAGFSFSPAAVVGGMEATGFLTLTLPAPVGV